MVNSHTDYFHAPFRMDSITKHATDDSLFHVCAQLDSDVHIVLW